MRWQSVAPTQPIDVLGVTANCFVFQFRRHIGATSATWVPRFSSDLLTSDAAGFTHLGSVNNGDGTETVAFCSIAPAPARAFGSLQVTVSP